MVKANNNDIKSVKDLDGKVVAVKSGTVGGLRESEYQNQRFALVSKLLITRTWELGNQPRRSFRTIRTSCTLSKPQATLASSR